MKIVEVFDGWIPFGGRGYSENITLDLQPNVGKHSLIYQLAGPLPEKKGIARTISIIGLILPEEGSEHIRKTEELHFVPIRECVLNWPITLSPL